MCDHSQPQPMSAVPRHCGTPWHVTRQPAQTTVRLSSNDHPDPKIGGLISQLLDFKTTYVLYVLKLR